MGKGKQNLDNLRHSASHLLAAAVLELYPNAKPTLGPPIEDGFYYDFDNLDISDSDLPKIEKKMHDIAPSWKKFEKKFASPNEAKKVFAKNKYKKELIDEHTKSGEKITLYKSGDFVDLCKGGHVKEPSKELKHFKLLSLAGAYWRGDEGNPMLTRIYGTAFLTKEGLDKYLEKLKKAKETDHRKLGKELDFFSVSPLTGPGLILWHPKLATVRNIVEEHWKKEHIKQEYKLVYTPHIASMDMFVISRHYNKYIDSMFPAMLHQYIEGESKGDYSKDEQLKPMNCPNHIQIYKAHPRSYRELPIRMGELGTVYRYERAGTLHGMTRVRGFTQDDSHIFCTPEQVIDEVRAVIRLTKQMYDTFGFTDYQAYLSTRPEKYLGSKKMWTFAENSLKKAMEQEGIKNYKIDEGAGVFYGPKIDSKIKDSLGREWQLGTIQFDFNMPDKAKTTKEEIEEFWKMKTFRDKFKTKEKLTKYLKKLGRGYGVNYIDASGKKKQAVMIHRTILGSMERFFGVLIEHYAGSFPVWIAPLQVKVLPITKRNIKYAREIQTKLVSNGIRVELDGKNETLQAKIRNAQLEKVPYMLIVGDKEEKENKVSLRLRTEKDLGAIKTEKFIERIKKIIDAKALDL
jgi:threonyl-tRNA synthetase